MKEFRYDVLTLHVDVIILSARGEMHVNAYELADAIEDWDSDGQWDTPAANMLRQQADRIGVLEANYKIQVNIVEKQQDYIDQLEQGLRSSIDLNKSQVDKAIKQADRIAELEKDLKKYDQLAWDDLNKSKTIWCACGDGITADSGAKCGICASTTQQTNDGCGNCHACLVGVMENGYPVTMQRMIVCPDCGNKRCPKASNHRHQCTGSNEPNQRGSIYTAPRELSDEEILNIAFCSEIDTVAIENDWNGTVLQFAREILKKASEK